MYGLSDDIADLSNALREERRKNAILMSAVNAVVDEAGDIEAAATICLRALREVYRPTKKDGE